MGALKDFLKTVNLFSNLADGELEAVEGIVRSVTVPKGKTVIAEGDFGDEMYIIEEGSVQISRALTLKTTRTGYEDREKILIALRAPEHFGEIALLQDEARTATVTALEDCRLLAIRRSDFERLGVANPALGYKVMHKIAEILCDRLRHSNEDILKLTTALSIALSS